MQYGGETMKNKFNNMTDEIWKQSNEVSKEGREGFSDEQIKELRKAVQSMNSEFEVLENGTDDAIELDPDNEAHVEWMYDEPKLITTPLVIEENKDEQPSESRKITEIWGDFAPQAIVHFNSESENRGISSKKGRKTIPRLNSIEDKVAIDESDAEQVKWFEKFKELD